MKTIAKADNEHFQSGADKYAARLAVAAERILAPERKPGSRPEFAAVARDTQLIARHSCTSSGEETGP